MILKGGVYDGKPDLSASAITEMSSRQTGDAIKEGYGLGWATSAKAGKGSNSVIPGTCGHGGAYATNMAIDPRRQLITIFMVQCVGPGEEIDKVRSAFLKAAADAIAK
jgi:CubicO group peptidase (beta-lactamase class C family)